MPKPLNNHDPLGNRLLAALHGEVYQRILPQLEYVTLSLGDVIYESGAQMNYVYFPATSIISLVYTMLDGATAEMGLVGNEGLVGIAIFMGGNTTPSQAITQGAGSLFSYSFNTSFLACQIHFFSRHVFRSKVFLRPLSRG